MSNNPLEFQSILDGIRRGKLDPRYFDEGGILNLTKRELNDEDMRNLAKALGEKPKINIIDLSHNNIGPEGAKVLAKTKLDVVFLNHNKIGNEGAEALATSTTIINLDLSSNGIGNKIGNKGVIALAANTHILALDLSNNNIDSEGVGALAASTTLVRLDLSGNNIGDKEAKTFTKTTIEDLFLKDNDITSEGVKALAANTNILSLDLSNNKIGNEGAKALAAATKLTYLDVSNNNIDHNWNRAIEKILKRNEKKLETQSPTVLKKADNTNIPDVDPRDSLVRTISSLKKDMQDTKASLKALEASFTQFQEVYKKLHQGDISQEIAKLQGALEKMGLTIKDKQRDDMQSMRENMQNHAEQLENLSNASQNQTNEDKQFANALSTPQAKMYDYNMVASLNRTYMAAMISETPYFTPNKDSKVTMLSNIFQTAVTWFIPVASTCTDVITAALNKFGEGDVQSKLHNFAVLATNAAEMHEISQAVSRELVLSHSGRLTDILQQQHLKNISEAVFSGKLKNITGKEKIIPALANVAEGKEANEVRANRGNSKMVKPNTTVQNRTSVSQFRTPQDERERNVQNNINTMFSNMRDAILQNLNLSVGAEANLSVVLNQAIVDKALDNKRFQDAFLDPENLENTWKIMNKILQRVSQEKKLGNMKYEKLANVARDVVNQFATEISPETPRNTTTLRRNTKDTPAKKLNKNDGNKR